MTERAQRSGDLRTLIDLVVPADEFASAGEAGGPDFLQRYLAERPDLRARLDGLLAAADPTTHPDWDWFAGLVNGGFYADPANGGNAERGVLADGRLGARAGRWMVASGARAGGGAPGGHSRPAGSPLRRGGHRLGSRRRGRGLLCSPSPAGGCWWSRPVPGRRSPS